MCPASDARRAELLRLFFSTMSQTDPHSSSSAPTARWRGNLHVYFNALKHETRILKVTRSLAENGFAERIYVVGIWEPGLARHEVLDGRRQIRRFRLLIPRVSGNGVWQMLRVAEFCVRAVFFAIGRKIDLINCHMAVLLPVCVGLRRLLGAALVYEPHELESEQPGLTERRKRIVRRVEQKYVPESDLVIHVGLPAARWYEETFGYKPVHALNNTPYAAEAPAIGASPILRNRFQIPAGDLVFIYQGQLFEDRGIRLMLDVFAACPDKTRHLVAMGFGPCQAMVEAAARLHSNIHFLPAVPAPQILEHTAGADVGLCLRQSVTLDDQLANPNKMNEYFLAGIPMIVSDLPGLAHFVRERECGWVVKSNHEALAALVMHITLEEVRCFRNRIELTRGNFGWEQEEKTLVRIYEELWARWGKR